MDPAAAATDELSRMSLVEAAATVRSREISSRELVEAQLGRIARVDPGLRCYSDVFTSDAIAEADRMDRTRSRGLLHGVPISIKDNLDVAGHETTAGSPIFAGRVPVKDAEAVRRLRAAGAIVVGKTVLYELAFGAQNERWPPTRNPHDPSRATGGSSSGSVAAVAACLCFGSLGTDTGGSIRVPAGLCGVVGIKPTFDSVPTPGLIRLSRLDHIGPIARTVSDAALLLESLGVCRTRSGVSTGSMAGLRVGVVETDPGLDGEVATALESAVEALRGAGATARAVRLDREAAGRALWTIASADAAAGLLDLVRGCPGVHPLVRSRIEAGGRVPASEVAEAVVVQRQLTRELETVFRDVHVLLLPVAPLVSYRLDERVVTLDGRPEDVSAAVTRYTPLFNLTGAPALSLPFRRSAEGLPVAVQLAAAPHGETTLLRAARVLEEASSWV